MPAEMARENVRHARTKMGAAIALREAIRGEGARYQAFVGGMLVGAGAYGAFIPDALVCPPQSPDAVVIYDPLIVVEVLSPSTAPVDHGIKLEGYFSLPSVEHYLILDPDGRMLIHHARGEDELILTRILRDGALRLEPPGLDLRVEDLFGPAEEGAAQV